MSGTKSWYETLIQAILNELLTPVGGTNLLGVILLCIVYWEEKQRKLKCLDKARELYGSEISKEVFFKKVAETSHFEVYFPYILVVTVIISVYFVYRYVVKRDVRARGE
ncbi:MAG: hypothetical protein ABSG97_08330 [Sedimentisphaerales bacterium]|jgi:hypothetical protein